MTKNSLYYRIFRNLLNKLMKIKKRIFAIIVILLTLSACLPEFRPQKTGFEYEDEPENEVNIDYLYSDEFIFYGTKIDIEVPDNLKEIDLIYETPINEEVDEILFELKKNGMSNIFKKLIDQSNKIGLDDFGYNLLVKKFANKFFEYNTSDLKQIVIWYGLREKELGTLLIYSENEILCLYQTNEILFNTNEITLNGLNYFSEKDFSRNCDIIQTPDKKLFPLNESRPLKFNSITPQLDKRIAHRDRIFTFDDEEYTLKLSYNKNIANYFDAMPLRNIGRYLIEMNPSEEAKASFREQIPGWLKDKSYGNKIRFLLKLVENGFPYKADEREKFNFVEQSISDDYTDCDDRGVLFCYLAKEFIGAKVLLIAGPNHVCGAVEIDIKNKELLNRHGLCVLDYNGVYYLVCDPSYMNGQPGLTVFTQKQLADSITCY